MPETCDGARPTRSSRALVSPSVKPQSIMTRVAPLSTTSPLPELPLPSEVNLSMLPRGVDRQRSCPVQRPPRCRSSRRCPLLELVVEEREDLLARGARFRRALHVLHLHLRHARAGVGDVNAVLRLRVDL